MAESRTSLEFRWQEPAWRQGQRDAIGGFVEAIVSCDVGGFVGRFVKACVAGFYGGGGVCGSTHSWTLLAIQNRRMQPQGKYDYTNTPPRRDRRQGCPKKISMFLNFANCEQFPSNDVLRCEIESE